MRGKSVFQRLAALLCAAALLLCLPPRADAAEAGLSASVVSCTEGDTCYVYITAANLEKLSALELTVFYDADALTLSSAKSASQLDVSSINTATAGVVRLTAASSAKDGISGSLTVLTLRFQAKEGSVGTHSIQLALGSALNTDRSTLSLSLLNGSVTVTEKTQSTKVQSYSLRPSATKLYQGDTLTLKLSLTASCALQAGNFAFSYDPELLSFESITPAKAAQSGVWSVNSQNRGYVLFSWAGQQPLNYELLLSSQWTVLADTDEEASIVVHPFELYDKNHASLSAANQTQTLKLQKKAVEPTYPALYLSVPDTIRATQPFTATLWAEAGTGLAAADLAVQFDPEVLKCTGVRRAKQAEDAGISVVCAEPGTSGTQTLSLLCAEGLTEAVALAEFDFTPLKQTEKVSLTLSQRTTSVDKDYNKLKLTFRAAEFSVLSEFLNVTFLDADGNLIETKPVRVGTDATAPTPPARSGTKDVCPHFSGWSGSLENVTEDRTLTAQYTPGEHESFQYEKDSGEAHTRVCGICGYFESDAHNWGAEGCTLCGEALVAITAPEEEDAPLVIEPNALPASDESGRVDLSLPEDTDADVARLVLRDEILGALSAGNGSLRLSCDAWTLTLSSQSVAALAATGDDVHIHVSKTRSEGGSTLLAFSLTDKNGEPLTISAPLICSVPAPEVENGALLLFSVDEAAKTPLSTQAEDGKYVFSFTGAAEYELMRVTLSENGDDAALTFSGEPQNLTILTARYDASGRLTLAAMPVCAKNVAIPGESDALQVFLLDASLHPLCQKLQPSH